MSERGGPRQPVITRDDLKDLPEVNVWMKPDGTYTIDDPGNEWVNCWHYRVMPSLSIEDPQPPIMPGNPWFAYVGGEHRVLSESDVSGP